MPESLLVFLGYWLFVYLIVSVFRVFFGFVFNSAGELQCQGYSSYKEELVQGLRLLRNSEQNNMRCLNFQTINNKLKIRKLTQKYFRVLLYNNNIFLFDSFEHFCLKDYSKNGLFFLITRMQNFTYWKFIAKNMLQHFSVNSVIFEYFSSMKEIVGNIEILSIYYLYS